MIANTCCCGGSGGGSSTVPLSQIEEGHTITLNENDAPVKFYVAKHDYESDLNGTGRTLIVRKYCYDSRRWNSSNQNDYINSSINAWLNNTYLYLLDADIRKAIGTTKFRYTFGNGSNALGTMSKPVFLLSATELFEHTVYTNDEGTKLGIADALRTAYLDGKLVYQWTRSPAIKRVTQTTTQACVTNGSSIPPADCTDTNGSRPVFTLPSTFPVILNGGGASVGKTVTLHITVKATDTDYTYAVAVQGKEYGSAADVEVEVGDTVFCKVMNRQGYSHIMLNGYQAAEASRLSYATFWFAVTENTAIVLDQSYIRITT